jgi:exosortase/archaeosortase family protein
VSVLQSIKQKIGVYMNIVRRNSVLVALRFLPFFSFFVPFSILYLLYPHTFEPVWTGTWENRIGYLLFLWLFSLETVIAWDQIKEHELSIKKVTLIVATVVPTIYVIVANYFGLNQMIINLSLNHNIKYNWAILMPMSLEYMIFAFLFIALVALMYGRCALKTYAISASFLMVIGVIYIINNIFPFGEFAPFQVLAIPTAVIAEKVLNLMGYKTILSFEGNIPILLAVNPENFREYFAAGIDWPCAGVESLMIYTITVLLFLKKSDFSLKLKIFYYSIGAVITFFINVLRVVTIYVIAIHGGAWGVFHDYFGPLYSIVWIVLYPLIIIKSQSLLNRLQSGE